ncbi:MAG TPA: hypothetical protein PKL88_01275 [bacterium]|nr:hypothetical protein [bacterium]HPD74355.1 hypothetical protein [bacterium]
MNYIDFSNIGTFEKVCIAVFFIGVVLINLNWIFMLSTDYKNWKRDLKIRKNYKEYLDYKK